MGCSQMCTILMTPYEGDKEAENLWTFPESPDDFVAGYQYPYGAGRHMLVIVYPLETHIRRITCLYYE